MASRMYGSTVVAGRLYERGLLASRDRLAVFSDALWPDDEIRPNGGTHRRWNDEQIEILRCALTLADCFGVRLEEIAALVDSKGLGPGLLAAAQKRRPILDDVSSYLERFIDGVYPEQLSA